MNKCYNCGRKMKKKYCREQFGSGDIDTLALAMYEVFHGRYQSEETGWPKYSSQKHDNVVLRFRDAAYAAASVLAEARVGEGHGWIGGDSNAYCCLGFRDDGPKNIDGEDTL